MNVPPVPVQCCLVALLCAPVHAQEERYVVTQGVPGFSFGRHVDVLGDVDGDGVDDFLATGLGVHVTQSYQVQVLSGRDGSPLHSITRPANTGFGRGLAGVGDVSGDGIPDYAAGNPWADLVQVRSGVDSGALYQVQWSTPGMFGASLSGLGDVNGDGVADFVIGIPGQINPGDGDPNEPGRVRVVSGIAGATIWEVIGAEFSYAFQVDRADADGDGVADVLVGAPELGLVEVLNGADGSLLHAVTRPRDFGRDVCGIGDVDGDGCEDFLVAAPSRTNWTRPGRAYLYSGRQGRRLFKWVGTPGDEFGWNVSAAGDVNGDGVEDCLVGMGANGPSMPAVFSSDDGALLYEWDSPGRLGHDVTGLGDVDGDGLGEVLIGHVSFGVGGAVRVYGGSPLYLRASPRQPGVGQVTTLHVGRSAVGSPTLLVLVDVDGVPCQCPVLGVRRSAIDGFVRVPVSVTPSMAGTTFTLSAVALDPIRGVLWSGRETLTVN